MDATAARHYAKSLVWNLDRKLLLDCVSTGITVDILTVTEEGWTRVSRHAAGQASAYVQANKIKKVYPNLETNVRRVEGEEWSAEVWAKVKDTTQD